MVTVTVTDPQPPPPLLQLAKLARSGSRPSARRIAPTAASRCSADDRAQTLMARLGRKPRSSMRMKGSQMTRGPRGLIRRKMPSDAFSEVPTASDSAKPADHRRTAGATVRTVQYRPRRSSGVYFVGDLGRRRGGPRRPREGDACAAALSRCNSVLLSPSSLRDMLHSAHCSRHAAAVLREQRPRRRRAFGLAQIDACIRVSTVCQKTDSDASRKGGHI